MSRVGEAYRPEVGQTRPAAGFLLGAASLLGLRRFFAGAEAPASFLPPVDPAPLPPPVTPIFRPSDLPWLRKIHQV